MHFETQSVLSLSRKTGVAIRGKIEWKLHLHLTVGLLALFATRTLPNPQEKISISRKAPEHRDDGQWNGQG